MDNSRNAKIDLSLEDEEIVIRMDKEGAHLLMEMVGRFEDFRRFLNDEGWSFIRRNSYSWDHFARLSEDTSAFGLALNDEIWRQKTGVTFEEWYDEHIAKKEEG